WWRLGGAVGGGVGWGGARGAVRGGAGPRLAGRRRDPADVADRIRHLGELHRAGLVTDEEFSVKKAELLAEL
ncbi:SHOCT domain-containing protein, partial [Streptomyces sp. NPDC059895]|uniref:SHOCT domain-containing protein n=1 Tax=Streptomyces sp. NPDC059895 TaxID=3346992 RepID=UPI00364A74D6